MLRRVEACSSDRMFLRLFNSGSPPQPSSAQSVMSNTPGQGVAEALVPDDRRCERCASAAKLKTNTAIKNAIRDRFTGYAPSRLRNLEFSLFFLSGVFESFASLD